MIGGCPRSGTTALLQTLNSNSSVLLTSEENLLNLVRVLRKLLGTRERRSKVFDKNGTRDLSQRETLTPENALASTFSEEAVWPTIKFLYEWHHSQACDDFPLTLWGDKFPNYFKNIDDVLSIDGARYIHITRNPFDVVNSMLRRTAMARQGKDWWRAITDVDTMIGIWEEAFRTITQVGNHADVFHLHYEELVFDFEASIFELNQFLKIDLVYHDILVNNPQKHYDRSYLSSEIIKLLLKSSEVCSYIEQYTDNPDFTYVSASLKNLGQQR